MELIFNFKKAKYLAIHATDFESKSGYMQNDFMAMTPHMAYICSKHALKTGGKRPLLLA